EPRPPFLDRRVIELHAWLPLDLRLREGWDKWVLRDCLSHSLPGTVSWRQLRAHLGEKFTQSLTLPWVGKTPVQATAPPYFRRAGEAPDNARESLVGRWLANRY
ncbi:MAG: asparagine synthase-related protein, partial [Arenimonas sp.]|nr:asparagine synthase-related protein [Arenimonas sp.]